MYRSRGKGRGLVLKVVGVYFGYRILHHEVYETDTAEPLLVALGLWFMGIPLASFFDGLKKLGASAEQAVKDSAAVEEAAKPELQSGSEAKAGGDGA